MEGKFKHKVTGAINIFSEPTFEILGGHAEWEYLGEFDPTEDVEEESVNQSVFIEPNNENRVREVSDLDTSNHPTEDVEEEKSTPKKSTPKKALTAEELDNE